MDIYALIKEHDEIEEKLDKTREQLQEYLFPIIRKMGKPLGRSEKLTNVAVGVRDMVTVSTEWDWGNSTETYIIHGHILRSEFPLEAADAYRARQEDARQHMENEIKRATIRRLSEELRQLQGEVNDN